MQKLIIVVGPICSGKTSLCKQLVENGHVEREIAIGDIVRDILKKETRTIDSHLDTDIIMELARRLSDKKTTVISGVRQRTILDWILWNNNGHGYEIVYLDAPMDVLSERYYSRKAKKDDEMSFERAYEKDWKLFADTAKYILGPNFTRLKAKILNTIEAKPKQDLYELYKETLQES